MQYSFEKTERYKVLSTAIEQNINNKLKTVSVVVPIYNSATILQEVLNSLEEQEYPIHKVILIDNNSKDSSFEIMKKYAQTSKFCVCLIRHDQDKGLSYSYNEAIDNSETDFLITLQSDCVIPDKEGIKKILDPFDKDNGIVVACSLQTTPWKVWQEYNFWQKCLFSRHVGKIMSGRNGRFCCFSLQALRNVGKFDENTYRTAGEDGDILFRLSSVGKIVDVDLVVEHLHNKNPDFSLGDYIYKENQLAEAVGACLGRNFGKISITQFTTALLRVVLVLGMLLPKIGFFFMGLVVLYSVYFTNAVFLRSWNGYKIILLFFVNIFLLFSYSYYFLKGFFLKRQML